MPTMTGRPTGEATVVVAGAGGNIGSHLVPHLARMPGIGHLVLIDRDVYEERNLGGQSITARSVGRGKAVVQAREARGINPGLRVTALADDVEDLPLGALRGDVILACLDSRRARQTVNQAARRLGVPWIDAGVLGEALLARIDVYLPGTDAPCLECAWDAGDYAAIEQGYPCSPDGGTPPATAAPSALGGLAAALQAIECGKLLRDGAERPPAGMQVVLDAGHHRHFLTARRRNPACRLRDHEAWAIRRLPTAPRDLTLGDVLEIARRRFGQRGPLRLSVEGKGFVRELACTGCGRPRRLLRLAAALRPGDRRCPRCGSALALTGSGLLERLEPAALRRCRRDLPLDRLGLRPGEVVTLGSPEGEVHVEIGTGQPSRRGMAFAGRA